MERKFLEGLGLEKEAIDKIMAEHGKTVNSLKADAGKVEGLESQITAYKQQLEDRDKQLKELKKVDADALQKKIDELQETNENDKKAYQEKLDKQAFDFALDKALTGAKAKNAKAVKPFLDNDKLKLDGENILGLDDQLKTIKENDPYLFDQEQQQTPPTIVNPGNPNGGGGTNVNPFTKEHWNLTEQGKLFKENPELYKNLKSQAGK
ncbi:phage scaffolding protein [Oceanobacillus sojae]|uniref:phage scaffolding protein n=1 Tax=Oceanobacillus sojae TaxID=582851 RepID=UPI0021A294A7|nr:phage scaffolding protein [Oceanobacillus sojae]MCT1904111.1 phage scaffolding protein [Oceanobacillus sojae]